MTNDKWQMANDKKNDQDQIANDKNDQYQITNDKNDQYQMTRMTKGLIFSHVRPSYERAVTCE